MNDDKRSDAEIRAEAHRDWHGDDVEIGKSAGVERVDGGFWVAAQVWVEANTPREP